MRRRYRYDARSGELVEIQDQPRSAVAPRVQGDLPGYESPVSGKWIEGRKARREDFKRTNTREWEGLGSEQRAAAEIHKDREKRSEAKLTESAHRAWAEAPSDVRRILSKR